MGIGEMFAGEPGAAPHAQIGAPEGLGRGVRAGEPGEVRPRHGRVEVMVEVPVMMQPEQVEGAPDADVDCAAVDIARGAVVVDVLEGGPEEAEAAEHGEPPQRRDVEAIDQRAVEEEDQRGFEADAWKGAWVEGFLQRCGGPVEARARTGQPRRVQQGGQVAQHDDQPEEAGEDAVELEVFPRRAVAGEIEIEGFVVGAVAEVMAEVTLAAEGEGAGKEQREHGAGPVVHGLAGVEKVVFGLVAQGVAGGHHQGVGEGKQTHGRPGFDASGGPEQGEAEAGHERGEGEVQARGDGMGARGHAVVAGT